MSTIKTALTSYGKSGLVFHGPLLETHTGFEIKKILERNRSDSAEKHPGASIVRSYDAILNDTEIELVIINTPDYLHYDMSMEALSAGKHIVVEKPFTLNCKEADSIIKKASEKNLMVSVFQNRRWDGDFLTVKQVIEEKKLGRLVSFESHFDRFRNYIQDSWKDMSKFGAGTLYNLGSHMIDQALQLFGMPEYLYGDVRSMRKGSQVDDSFDIFLHYNDVKCLVRGSYLVKEQGPRYILHGTEGSFVKYGIDPQEENLEQGQLPGLSGWGHDQPGQYGILNLESDDNDLRTQLPTIPGDYTTYYDNIYDHMRGKEPLAVTAEQARDVIKIIEAAYTSSAEKRVVMLK